jgi:hypothetical protein
VLPLEPWILKYFVESEVLTLIISTFLIFLIDIIETGKSLLPVSIVIELASTHFGLLTTIPSMIDSSNGVVSLV